MTADSAGRPGNVAQQNLIIGFRRYYYYCTPDRSQVLTSNNVSHHLPGISARPRLETIRTVGTSASSVTAAAAAAAATYIRHTMTAYRTSAAAEAATARSVSPV